MTDQASPTENRALAESAQRSARLQEALVPVARSSFRVAGGLLATLFAWVLGMKLIAAARSDSPLSALAAEDLGMMLAILVLGLAFGLVAWTGRVPEWLWNRMLRHFGHYRD